MEANIRTSEREGGRERERGEGGRERERRGREGEREEGEGGREKEGLADGLK